MMSLLLSLSPMSDFDVFVCVLLCWLAGVSGSDRGPEVMAGRM